ncbi:flavin reductase family protein [Methyloversatilis sp. XJ19-49]|uniref:flavin reductase family protein n=1 Tax=Methyloversatilis sp. XJ19-49 TaxID=2963429 RepID=UPI00211BB8D3|nr:flavin reductase family protein [Methyloversatilis sp. XJ19-49]
MPASTVETVELAKAYRLLNHGPTVLVSSAYGAQRNVMAAAWCMPLDFEPPKLLVVIDKSTFTRELIEASGEFAINVPTQAQRALTVAVGSDSGRERDKFAELHITTFAGDTVAAPLIEGCVAWLECRVIPETHNQNRYDLFIGEVVAAHADSRVFSAGRWHFGPEHDALRTIHHVAGGAFFVTGPMMDGGAD